MDNDLFLRLIKEAKILNNKKDYNGSKQILVSLKRNLVINKLLMHLLQQLKHMRYV